MRIKAFFKRNKYILFGIGLGMVSYYTLSVFTMVALPMTINYTLSDQIKRYFSELGVLAIPRLLAELPILIAEYGFNAYQEGIIIIAISLYLVIGGVIGGVIGRVIKK